MISEKMDLWGLGVAEHRDDTARSQKLQNLRLRAVRPCTVAQGLVVSVSARGARLVHWLALLGYWDISVTCLLSNHTTIRQHQTPSDTIRHNKTT